MGIVTAMWRAVAVLRWASLAWAASLIVAGRHDYAHPAGAWAVLATMVAWTAATTFLYRLRGRPRGLAVLLTADLAVTAVCVAAVAWVDSPAQLAGQAPTLTVSWGAAPVAACAVAGGPWWGLAAGAVIGVVTLVARQHAMASASSDLVLVLLVGGVAGYLVRLSRRASRALAEAAQYRAATAERDRLAREIHDSVLQSLAMIHRRGRAAGGVAAELAELAAQQERALRELVAREPAALPRQSHPGTVDVAELLRRAAATAAVPVELSLPAHPVLLPEPVAAEVAAAVGQGLDNVARHAGPAARAWLLLDDQGAAVSVSLRDDGTGCEPARFAEAAGTGRLGVSRSMRGRIEAVGGRMSIEAAPGHGVEVEFHVPR